MIFFLFAIKVKGQKSKVKGQRSKVKGRIEVNADSIK